LGDDPRWCAAWYQKTLLGKRYRVLDKGKKGRTAGSCTLSGRWLACSEQRGCGVGTGGPGVAWASVLNVLNFCLSDAGRPP